MRPSSSLSPSLLVLAALLLSLAGPMPAPAQDGPTPNLARGVSADTVYQTDDFGTINLFNGNLTVAVPLGGRYPVGADFDWGLSLVYNASAWDFEREHCFGPEGPGVNPPQVRKDYQVAVPDPLSNAGLGWSLSLGRLLYPDPTLLHATALHPDRWTFVAADGGRHGFHDRLHPDIPAPADQLFTTDGSYLRMRELPAGHTDCQGQPQPGDGCRVLDHPDGRSHIFVDLSSFSGGTEDWRPGHSRDGSTAPDAKRPLSPRTRAAVRVSNNCDQLCA